MTTRTLRRVAPRASTVPLLLKPALVEDLNADPELTAAWRAYCARVGRDSTEPPWSLDEMRAAFPGLDVVWI